MSDAHHYLQLLQRYKYIAIVGISIDVSRASYLVAHYLQLHGYTIIPINPRYVGKSLLGNAIYRTLQEAKEAGERIEIVDVFRKSEDTLPIAEESINIGAKMLWLQLGIFNADAGRLAHDAGLTFVEDRCIKVEHERCFGFTGYRKNFDAESSRMAHG